MSLHQWIYLTGANTIVRGVMYSPLKHCIRCGIEVRRTAFETEAQTLARLYVRESCDEIATRSVVDDPVEDDPVVDYPVEDDDTVDDPVDYPVVLLGDLAKFRNL